MTAGRFPLALAAVIAGALLCSAPAALADEIDNYWDGTWNTSHHGTKGMVLNLDQKKGSRTVTGSYTHPRDKNGDRGRITAEAKGKFGKRLVGRYKSSGDGGGGGFELTLQGTLAGFNGEFWPCRYRFYCDVIEWTGKKPGFE